MTGAGGTSKTGQTHHYYLCKSAKDKKCDKKRFQKQFIEDIVISKIKEFLTKDNINHIASTMVSLIEEEQDNIRLSQLKKSIKNIDRKKTKLISAIAECDDSNIRKSLYEELSSIEQQCINIESDILSEESIINTLSKSNIKRFLNQLKDGNENDIKHRKSLIATFLNAIYIYKDKATIYFNNQKEPVEISLDKIKKTEKFFSGKVRPAK